MYLIQIIKILKVIKKFHTHKKKYDILNNTVNVYTILHHLHISWLRRSFGILRRILVFTTDIKCSHLLKNTFCDAELCNTLYMWGLVMSTTCPSVKLQYLSFHYDQVLTSEWEVYIHFIYKKHYCIIINHALFICSTILLLCKI